MTDATTPATVGDDNSNAEIPKRQARIEAAVDFILGTTRRGYQSQVEKLLSRDQLVAVGMLKASGTKTDDIHERIVGDYFGGDSENSPSPTALQRWVNRFSETYRCLRAADHEKLVRAWQRKEEGADGIATEANYGLAQMAEMVNAALLDVDDPRELTNGQLANFGAILAQAAKAARDDRKLDTAIAYTEQRIRLLDTRNRELELKVQKIEDATREAVEAVERESERSGDGRVDVGSIIAKLRESVMGGSEAA